MENNKIQLPKNIRQIGETDKYHKIYMEDYVVTYLRQLAATTELGSRAVALFGNVQKDDSNIYFFVYGAVCTERKRLEEGKPLFEEEDKQYILEKKNTFFRDKELIGWALLENEFNRISEDGIWRNGENDFSAENKLFLHSDITNQTEIWKIYSCGIEREILGYAVFYDKNEAMQAFLVEWHRRRNEYSIENVRDNAAKKFRTMVTEKQENSYQSKAMSFFYLASTFLMIILCVTGITTINHYQKMKEMETALSHLVQAIEEKEQTTEMDVPKEPEMEKRELEDKAVNENMLKEQEIEAQTVETAVQEVQEEPQAEKPQAEEPVSQEAPVPEMKENRDYVIQEGDTLMKISQQYYQTSRKVAEICALNQIKNPDSIKSGQKILLPQ